MQTAGRSRDARSGVRAREGGRRTARDPRGGLKAGRVLLSSAEWRSEPVIERAHACSPNEEGLGYLRLLPHPCRLASLTSHQMM